MYAPFLVAMRDSKTMDAWLASTDVHSGECFKISDAKRQTLSMIEENDSNSLHVSVEAQFVLAGRTKKNNVDDCFPCNPGNAVLIKM
jgi:hypothetical protein